MRLTDISLRNPAAMVVGVVLVIALGLFSLRKLPIQLFPDIDEPQITIMTTWRAAAPAEVESELIEPQEAALQGLQGVKQLKAVASPGGSWINLRGQGTSENRAQNSPAAPNPASCRIGELQGVALVTARLAKGGIEAPTRGFSVAPH